MRQIKAFLDRLQYTEMIVLFKYVSDKEVLTKIVFSPTLEEAMDRIWKEVGENDNEEEKVELISYAKIIDPGLVEAHIHRTYLKRKTRPKNKSLTEPDDYFKLSVADKRDVMLYVTFRTALYLALLYGIIGLPLLMILVILALSA